MNNSFDDDFTDDEVEEGLWATVKAVTKLIAILSGYGAAFLSTVQLGFWLATSHIQDIEKRAVLEWATEVYIQRDWKDPHILSLLVNCCLLLTFGLQHTLMSRRRLQETRIWDLIHFDYHIDKPIYLGFTALALQVLMYFWQPIPVIVWTINGFTLDSTFSLLIHCSAWALLYGTTLMLDLPEMIGLTQVAISSPTITAKSPDLESLHVKQRHMGLVPFILILLAFPDMSLDRLLLTLGAIYYMNRQWTSYTCYQYTRSMKQAKRYSL